MLKKSQYPLIAVLVSTIFVAGCARQQNPISGSLTTKKIVDMAGRSVTVPVKINKVFSTSLLAL